MINKKRVKTAVVLAGGAGLRLRPLTNNRPKAMVKLLGKPILQWVIEWLKANGILNIIIGVAYRKKVVMDYFEDGTKFGVKITYSVHSVEGGTGEGFRLAISRYVDDDVLIALNGDEITNFDLKAFVDYHCSPSLSLHEPIATIAVTNPLSPFGVVKIDEKGLVASFEEKPIIPSLLVNIGVYVFSRDILRYLPEKDPIEKTTFPLLARRKLLRAYRIGGTWLTINTMKDLILAENTLKRKVEEGTWLK